jgi:hypothetical protein
MMNIANAVLKLINKKGLVKGVSEYRQEYADPSFSDLIEYYKRDEYVGYTIEAFTTRTVGMGFFLTGDQPRALKLIDNFCNANKLFDLHWKIARDLWLSGNAFVNTVPSNQITTLHYLPLSSIQRIIRDESGNVDSYVQSWGGMIKYLSNDEVFHYKFNSIDENAFGEGLVNRLLRSGKGYLTEKNRLRKRMPLLKIREKMIDNAHRILSRYQPRHIYKNIPSSKIDEFVSLLNNIEPEQDFAADFNLEVEEARMDPRTRFEALLDYLDRMYVIGLHNPMLRLITLAGFTYASSQAAMETIEPEIRTMQFIIKQYDEELFRKVIEQHGGNAISANIELHWGMPERPELLISDIINAYQSGLEYGAPIITREEAREMLRESGWIIREYKSMAIENYQHFLAFKGKVYAISDKFYRYLREVRESNKPALINAPMVKENE